MEKYNQLVRQREKAFGESFRALRLLVAPEPVKGNVDPCAHVMSIECAACGEFRWYRGIYALSICSGRF